MSPSKGFFWRLLFYCCYAIGLTAILLYVQFPGVQFKNYCIRKIEQLFDDTDCKITRLVYHFPFGMTFENMAFFSQNSKNSPVVLLQSVTLSPILQKLGKAYRLEGTGYSGEFSCIVVPEAVGKGFLLENLRIDGANLAEMKQVHESLGRRISGLLSFHGKYSGVVNQYLAGKGQGKVKIKEGKMALLQPVLTLKDITLQQVEMDLDYNSQVLRINKGKIEGKELAADFTSTVKMTSPWYTSGIAMKGNVAPNSRFTKDSIPAMNEVRALQRKFKKPAIPFRVSGNMQQPSFQFGL